MRGTKGPSLIAMASAIAAGSGMHPGLLDAYSGGMGYPSPGRSTSGMRQGKGTVGAAQARKAKKAKRQNAKRSRK